MRQLALLIALAWLGAAALSLFADAKPPQNDLGPPPFKCKRELAAKCPADVATVLDGKYALSAEVYAEYQRCLSDIPLDAPFEDVVARQRCCKENAVAASCPLHSPNDFQSSAADRPNRQIQADAKNKADGKNYE